MIGALIAIVAGIVAALAPPPAPPPPPATGIPAVLVAIRECESGGSYTAENPSSTASGAFQYLDSSWRSYGYAARYGVSRASMASPAQQDEAALDTLARSGTTPWNASRGCWG